MIDAYERKRWPVEGTRDPVEIIQYTIDHLGRSQTELAELIGRSRASEVLSRKRALTIEMINKISKAWGIPLALLATPYKLRKTASRGLAA